MKFTPRNLPPYFDSEVRRLKKKQAWTKAKKINKGQHWNKFRQEKLKRNQLHKLLQFKHNQFIAELPETLKKTLNESGIIVDKKQENKHKTNCHEGLSATNPNDMACMFSKYFKLASSNNKGVNSFCSGCGDFLSGQDQFLWLRSLIKCMWSRLRWLKSLL